MYSFLCWILFCVVFFVLFFCIQKSFCFTSLFILHWLKHLLGCSHLNLMYRCILCNYQQQTHVCMKQSTMWLKSFCIKHVYSVFIALLVTLLCSTGDDSVRSSLTEGENPRTDVFLWYMWWVLLLKCSCATYSLKILLNTFCWRCLCLRKQINIFHQL